MASINIFDSNAFSMISLTNAMNLGPYKPRMLGELGLFAQKPIRTTEAWIEKKNGKLSILNTANRGTMKDVHSTRPRTAVSVAVPHVPYFQTILADDIQNIRAFGSETELQAMGSHVNDQMLEMKDDHDVTHEYHRVGALKGQVLDGDGTTVILDLFNLFGLSQTVINFVGTIANFSAVTTEVIRTIADKLGNETFDGIVCLCGNTYFDAVIQHASMVQAYDRWRNGEFFRTAKMGPQWYSAAINGFEFQNVLFINYRGKIGDITFIPDTEAYYFPRGVDDLFEDIIAPADFMETVNTKGKRFYAKQERMPFDKGVNLHTQSNVLSICKRPDAVIKSTYSSTASSSSSA